MVYVKWVFILLFWGFVGSVLHYTLPQHDIVRVSDTYGKRVDPGANSWFWAQADAGTDVTMGSRDVFFIQTRRAGDDVMVYRNEDTGWGWPPYFKFDTANLQAEASDLRSTAADPQWAMLTHYGWRNEFFSIYPNAIAIRAVDGPDVTIIPWVNIIILTLLAAFFWAIWSRWRRFKRNRINPVLADMSEGLEAAGDSLAEKRGRFGRWLNGR
ncbi:hypothetical protein P775_02335 [Puniceibacterium antarcticum]|uniref:DUF1523 domain-containing protein n=1 Tax=Puniceibacterium antarcticum TaxID=1206336 RepID=A0A2G8RK03_9RHOB|nr:DUF1523 family protein [Puniceibacterium antarcticum]PIL21832.1 hypothetical protein P775_02335 [Puniceibacterium antarcticum]